jgi:hypothetical protein
MPTFARLFLFTAAAAVLAGCATTPPGAPGKHLVYRDATGTVMRQFDYPSEDFCRRVEQVAGRGARCQPDPVVTGLGASAILMYNPPGVQVIAHYSDMNRCRTDTGTLAPGVQLLRPCTLK